jgi:hypothetical protein
MLVRPLADLVVEPLLMDQSGDGRVSLLADLSSKIEVDLGGYFALFASLCGPSDDVSVKVRAKNDDYPGKLTHFESSEDYKFSLERSTGGSPSDH